MKTKYILTIISILIINQTSRAHEYTWLGNDTVFSRSGNWSSPTGITYPGSGDTAIIVSASNRPVLASNQDVTRLVVNSGSFDLKGYTFTATGSALFSGGTINSGDLVVRGTKAEFTGTTFNVTIDVLSDQIKLGGGIFNEICIFTTTGQDNSNSDGGCVFNDDVTIVHKGNNRKAFRMQKVSGDQFNGTLVLINMSNGQLTLADADTTVFNGNVELNNMNTGLIYIGYGGGYSELTSGNTISVGDSGFYSGELYFMSFAQKGSTTQTLTLTDSSSLYLKGCMWEANVTLAAPDILCSLSQFNGTTQITKTKTSGNYWFGENIFNGNTTITYQGTGGGTGDELRLADSNPNIYNENINFESSGNPLQVVTNSSSEFHKNISTNNTAVTFLSGAVFFKGNHIQELNGTVPFDFDIAEIDKTQGNIILNTDVDIYRSVEFTNGNIVTDSINIITFQSASEANGAHNGSFVSGPVKKVGDTEFEFPVGEMNAYLPISISAPLSDTDAFTAQMYFSRQLLGNDKESTLDYLSEYNHWKLERITGSSKVKISLKWDNRYTPIIDTARLKLAYWDVDEWKDLGHGHVTGNYIHGHVTSTDSLNDFGYIIHAYSENSEGMTNRGIGFIRNDGQIINFDSVQAPEVLFYSNNGEFSHYYKNDTIMLVQALLHHYTDTIPDSLYRFDMVLLNGSNTTTPIGVESNSGYLNFILGYIPEPVVEVPNFRKVVYESVFDDIDLIVTKENGIGYQFIIHSGGSVDSIKFKYEGATSVSEIDDHMFITTPLGELEFDSPQAWYDSAGVKIPVDAGYIIIGEDSVSLEIGPYNPEFAISLSFGPSVPLPPNNAFGHMYWSTFVETNVNITDAYFRSDDNTIYSIGNTNAQVFFPVAGSIYPTVNNNSQDAIVVKFKTNRDVEWWTYYGGGFGETENRIWVDPSDNVVIAGVTGSSDLPIFNCGLCPSNCYCQGFMGSSDLYMAKIDPNGQMMSFSTFLGGGSAEELHSITGDLNGNIYLGGVDFNSSSFPYQSQVGAYNQTYGGGGNDPFIAKFNTLNQLIWCTSVGGNNSEFAVSNNEEVTGMCTDNQGNLYVTGTTGSPASDPFLTCSPCTTKTNLAEFPVTDLGGSAFKEGHQGYTDAYFIKFDVQNRLVWSTMFGGSNIELFQGYAHNNKGIAVNNAGEIFSISSTKSNDIDDWTPSATTGSYFQDMYKGNFDMYIVKFSPQFELLYATLYGGTNDDVGIGVTTDNYGNVYFTGSTSTSQIATDPFPLQPPNASSPGSELVYQSTYGGGSSDAFLIKFQSNLKHLLTTYLGGDGTDVGKFVYSNSAGNNIITGGQSSSNNNFNLADPGGLSYFSGTNPGAFGGFVSNLVNVCTGCRDMNINYNQSVSEFKLFLFPNPAFELLYIHSSDKLLNGQLYFYDITGRKLSVPFTKQGDYFVAEVNNLSNGMYVCVYETITTKKLEKFMIHH